MTEIGPIKKCSLAYNSNGKSTGVVTMIFNKPGDASRAWKRFNGTPIDGGKKIMHVCFRVVAVIIVGFVLIRF